MNKKLIKILKNPKYLFIVLSYIGFFKHMDDRKYLEIVYKIRTGQELNLTNPQTFNEKLQWLKLYNRKPIYSKMVDKYAVKEYVANIIGEEYIIPTLGVWKRFEDIDFDKLPNQFVIKCTHDSGSVTVCEDKTKLDIVKLKKQYEFYLRRNYAFMTYEMHYKNIPHRIVIEKYMGQAINDYKFLCFNGRPLYCWVDVDRFSNHKRNIYDLDWNLQPFNQFYSNSDKAIEKPACFDEMIRIVTRLCKGFSHVRVDLYLIDGKIYFGEMTFTNGGGNEVITPDKWDKKLGDLWEIDTLGRSNHNRKKKIKDYVVDRGE